MTREWRERDKVVLLAVELYGYFSTHFFGALGRFVFSTAIIRKRGHGCQGMGRLGLEFDLPILFLISILIRPHNLKYTGSLLCTFRTRPWHTSECLRISGISNVNQ